MNNSIDAGMVYCRGCGKQVHVSAITCPGCGAPQRSSTDSDVMILPVFLLCFFFGFLGVHRFYVGKVGTGVLQLLTFGGLGIWFLIDFVMIIVGSFTDKDGRKITQWN